MKEQPQSGSGIDWEKHYHARASEYFRIWDSGGVARLSVVREQTPQLVGAVETLIKTGEVVGQQVFNEDMITDTLVFLRKSPVEHPSEPQAPTTLDPTKDHIVVYSFSKTLRFNEIP